MSNRSINVNDESVEPKDFALEVALGNVQDTSIVNKFGYNLDLDIGTEELIASFGGAFNPTTNVMTTAQTFTITYNNTTDGSGQAGALQLLITYIDENFNQQLGFHTLSNTGSDTTSFTGLGINRALVYSNGGLGWNANDITITATTDATTQAMIPALESVTQQAIYHTAIGETLPLTFLKVKALKTTGGQSPIVTIRGYSWSRVTNTRYEIYTETIDTSIEHNVWITTDAPFTVTGREVIYFTGETDKNDSNVKLRFGGFSKIVV